MSLIPGQVIISVGSGLALGLLVLARAVIRLGTRVTRLETLEDERHPRPGQ